MATGGDDPLARALTDLRASPDAEAQAACLARLRALIDAEEQALRAPAGRTLRACLGAREDYAQVVAWIERAAGTDLPALVEGAPGPARDAVLRTVHEASPRREGPYLRLSGWEAGEWRLTLERAAGGSLLLDEPLALPPAAQADLFAALEAAGAGAPRLLAASRWEVPGAPADLLWPPLARRLSLLRLRLDACLPLTARPGASLSPGAQAPTLADLEREAIARRLEEMGWQQQRTADSLGIDRKTLYRKIRAYGLEPGEPPRPGSPGG